MSTNINKFVSFSTQEADNGFPVVSGTTTVELDYVIPPDNDAAIPTIYEEVPSMYTDLRTNSQEQNEDSADTYQKLLRRDSDYVIPAVQEPSNEQVQ